MISTGNVGSLKQIVAATMSKPEVEQDKQISICDVLKSVHSSESITLSDDHCKQLIQLLQHSMNSGGSIVQPNDWFSTMHSTQFTGNSLHLANNVFSHQSYNTDTWILDTGAMDHITLFGHLLHNVIHFQSTLHLPNSATATVTSIGSVHLSSDIILDNVLCVPEFAYNLLSNSKLVSDSKCVAVFSTTVHVVLFKLPRGTNLLKLVNNVCTY